MWMLNISRFIPLSSIALFCCLLHISCSRTSVTQPVSVIWDTDIGPDFDDAGALAMLHQLADSGRIRLLATMASNRYLHTIAVLQILNSWYGRPQLPIGLADSISAPIVPDACGWTDSLMHHYGDFIRQAATPQPAVMLYRKLLATAPDTSVVIISTGFFSNLATLLRSGADRYAQVNGTELVRQKVKYLISMAGAFPEGREFNIYNDPAAAAYVADHWPRPIIFSGYEIGEAVFTGLPLIQPAQKRFPLQFIFQIGLHCGQEDATGHPSWDETAVLAAMDTSHQLFDLHAGHIIIHPDGSNSWESTRDGHQYYLVLKTSRTVLAQLINGYLINTKPGK
jgi:inosine-uridine nucleoside N-ribohydrolase